MEFRRGLCVDNAESSSIFCHRPKHVAKNVFQAPKLHCGDVIMSTMESHVTSLTIFTQPFIQMQIKETSKLRVTGLCEGNSPVTGEFSAKKGPVTRKIFPLDDVIMKHNSLEELPCYPHGGSARQTSKKLSGHLDFQVCCHCL